MAPPTRTGAGGGGGGGGGVAASRPPTMPPIAPPTTPPSTPATAVVTPVSIPVSGAISFGASTGAAVGFDSTTGFGAAACCGGGGGGGGGGGAAATNAIICGTPGSIGAAISGMITTAAITAVCTAIDSGTVYHFWLPTLIDGSTTSPNISRGTVYVLLTALTKAGDYSQSKFNESTR